MLAKRRMPIIECDVKRSMAMPAANTIKVLLTPASDDALAAAVRAACAANIKAPELQQRIAAAAADLEKAQVSQRHSQLHTCSHKDLCYKLLHRCKRTLAVRYAHVWLMLLLWSCV